MYREYRNRWRGVCTFARMPTFLSSTGLAAGLLVCAITVTQGRMTQAPVSVKDVMVRMTEPSSTVIFEAQSEPPTTDKAWIGVQKAAQILADSGRLLTRPPLAKSDEHWSELAAAMVAEAEKTLAVAGKRDADALAEAADAVYLTCKSCHDRFPPPGR